MLLEQDDSGSQIRFGKNCRLAGAPAALLYVGDGKLEEGAELQQPPPLGQLEVPTLHSWVGVGGGDSSGKEHTEPGAPFQLQVSIPQVCQPGDSPLAVLAWAGAQ